MQKRTGLKLFRIENHLTQGKMAEIIGVSRATYIAAESGLRNPRPEFWETLRVKFDVPKEKMYNLMEFDKWEV